MSINKISLAALAVAALLGSSPAWAKDHRYSGTVQSINGNTVWISQNGQAYSIPASQGNFQVGNQVVNFGNLEPGMPVNWSSSSVYQQYPMTRVPSRYHGESHDQQWWSDHHHWHHYDNHDQHNNH